ncbi:hypothetical protein DFH09DRAFT_1315633 [Mycena vulgaris]|nr:hypothetical protein DFH09DRAFT_1315633 [Mycena vulgaris]
MQLWALISTHAAAPMQTARAPHRDLLVLDGDVDAARGTLYSGIEGTSSASSSSLRERADAILRSSLQTSLPNADLAPDVYEDAGARWCSCMSELDLDDARWAPGCAHIPSIEGLVFRLHASARMLTPLPPLAVDLADECTQRAGADTLFPSLLQSSTPPSAVELPDGHMFLASKVQPRRRMVELWDGCTLLVFEALAYTNEGAARCWFEGEGSKDRRAKSEE